jgi:hypothetical protein
MAKLVSVILIYHPHKRKDLIRLLVVSNSSKFTYCCRPHTTRSLITVAIYSGTLVCEHNSFRKRARNPEHSYIKANFPIRNNGNSDDSFQN